MQPRPSAETSSPVPQRARLHQVSFQAPATGTSLSVAARAYGATIEGTIVG